MYIDKHLKNRALQRIEKQPNIHNVKHSRDENILLLVIKHTHLSQQH